MKVLIARRSMPASWQSLLFGFLAIVLLSISRPSFVHAASFDCSKAATEIEHLICTDPRLSDLDSELSRSYRKARESERLINNKPMLQEQQIIWLRDIRNRCSNVECLRTVYEQRISQLEVPVTPDNCAVADQGVMAAVATCSGRELQMKEQHLSNLIGILILTKTTTASERLAFQEKQADWRKNLGCHCQSKAQGYRTGAAAIIIGCELKEVEKRTAEIREILQAKSFDFGGTSPPPDACKQ